MEFKDTILQHINLIKKYEGENFIEEQTKMYLIAPFLNVMGFNVFNPEDVISEFTADIGNKKGEKVDYALKVNGEIEILIEAKAINDSLNNHDIQLQRYFNVTKAKIGVLTNGIIYKFFTDLEEKNIMDNKPFLIVNFLDITDEKINELKKFTKSSYNAENILNSAENLKYSNSIKIFLDRQLELPDDEFIKLIGKEIYDGRLTQNKINDLKLIFKNTFKTFINDFARKKFESALVESNSKEDNINDELIEENEEVLNNKIKNIITTEDELEAFYILKSILRKYIEPNRITYKDTMSYFAIIIDDKVTKWVCRLKLNDNKWEIILPKNNSTANRKKLEEKRELTQLEDLYDLEEELKSILNELL